MRPPGSSAGLSVAAKTTPRGSNGGADGSGRNHTDAGRSGRLISRPGYDRSSRTEPGGSSTGRRDLSANVGRLIQSGQKRRVHFNRFEDFLRPAPVRHIKKQSP